MEHGKGERGGAGNGRVGCWGVGGREGGTGAETQRRATSTNETEKEKRNLMRNKELTTSVEEK